MFLLFLEYRGRKCCNWALLCCTEPSTHRPGQLSWLNKALDQRRLFDVTKVRRRMRPVPLDIKHLGWHLQAHWKHFQGNSGLFGYLRLSCLALRNVFRQIFPCLWIIHLYLFPSEKIPLCESLLKKHRSVSQPSRKGSGLRGYWIPSTSFTSAEGSCILW